MDYQHFLENVGDAFRQVRKIAGLNQREAALLVGTTQACISDLEVGRVDSKLKTLARTAHAYGYEPEINFVPIEEDTDGEALSEAEASQGQVTPTLEG